MAKIPVKPFIDGAVKYGPEVGKFVLKNADKLEAAVNIIKKKSEEAKNKKDDKIDQRDVHYRKARHDYYKKEMLNNLDQKSRSELFEYRTEINQFIEQIKAEQEKELTVKKPLHTKRTKNWEAILLQVEDKINLKDYQEYLRIYNKPSYESSYFNGFDTTISKFKQIIEKDNVEEVRAFVAAHTTIPEDTIKRAFI